MERRTVLSIGTLVAASGLLSMTGADTAQARPKGGFPIKGATGTFRSATGSGDVTADVLIQSLKVDPKTRGLSVSGVITPVGGALAGAKPQQFSAPATLTQGTAGSAVSAQAACSILQLDIGAIHLDLLGLVIDLSPINLDITAVPGTGLLGDLLCAIANLLNGPGLLSELLSLVNRINQILRGLGI